MLIVLAIGLLTFALVAMWLKARHERRGDHIKGSSNSGITTQRLPDMADAKGGMGSISVLETTFTNTTADTSTGRIDPASGRNSPVRTRDAFMPYGYGYSRSESRLASNSGDDRRSPLAQEVTLVDEEKEVGINSTGGRSGAKERNA